MRRWKEIAALTAVSLRGLFGYNEFRHTKEKKKRLRWIGLAVLWVLMYGMLAGYIIWMAAGIASVGMADVIPELLYLITSLVILFFSLFKAGEIIFQLRTYELLIALPVTKVSIVVSRFLTMYATDFGLSVLVLTPGMAVYAVYERPGALFYCFGLLGMAVLPLLPLTLATVSGAVIMAVGARMKHKSLVISALTVLLVTGGMMSTNLATSLDGEVTAEMVMDVTALISAWIHRLYPMAVWFNESTVGESAADFALLLAVSLGAYLLMTAIVSHWFMHICSALSATSAKQNYRMKTLKTSPVRKALLLRELKRYFASSIYVTNTLLGPVLMAAMAVSLYLMGWGKLEMLLGITGIPKQFLPLILAMMGALMPTTASAISMEGRQWWITRTLPLSSREVFDSKILVSLVTAAPCYAVAVVFSLLAVRPSWLQAVWLVVVPAVYLVFAAVAGITVNLAFPVFNWENETRAVKQSAAGSVMMLVDLLADVPPIVCLLVFGKKNADLVLGVTVLALTAVTVLLYRRNGRKDLLQIG